MIDKFSKMAHFIALSHPCSAQKITVQFFDSVYKLHGLPQQIISNRGIAFTSQIWKELMRLLGVQMLMNSAYHPQIDGQTERVNQCMGGDEPHFIGITKTVFSHIQNRPNPFIPRKLPRKEPRT